MKFRTQLAPLLALSSVLLTGCYTGKSTLTLKVAMVAAPIDKREGRITINVQDRRADKATVGKLDGRIGNNPVLVLSGPIEQTLKDSVTKVLEDIGYRIAPDRGALLECEIREFWVRGDGWTQGAKETIRARLRDGGGSILWERTFKGEDGGIDMATSFAEKSMNVALTRLLKEASDEFASEYFYQCVRKATPNL